VRGAGGAAWGGEFDGVGGVEGGEVGDGAGGEGAVVGGEGGEGPVEVGDAVGSLRGDGVGRWGGGVIVGGRVRAVVRRWSVERRVRAWGWGRRWRGLGGLIVLSGLPCCEGQNLIWIDFTWCTARLSTIFHPVAR